MYQPQNSLNMEWHPRTVRIPRIHAYIELPQNTMIMISLLENEQSDIMSTTESNGFSTTTQLPGDDWFSWNQTNNNNNQSSLLDDLISTTEVPYEPYEVRPETYLVPIVFGIIFIVGVLGNGVLVVVFVRHRAMRNVPNTWVILYIKLFYYY